MAKGRVSALDALRNVVGDGKKRTVAELNDAIYNVTGREPARTSLQQYFNSLRNEGLEFEVERGPGVVTTYKLVGRKGRRRAG